MPKAKAPEPPRTLVVDGVTYEVRRVRWGTLGVGSIILDRNDRRWTCIAAAQPQQFEYGKSCWLKFRAPRGEEFTAKPRYVTHLATALIDPTAPPVIPAWPDGAEEAWLLAQELGAEEIATQDSRTGEVWCPDYCAPNPAGTGIAPLVMHLEICHGVDVSALVAGEPVNFQEASDQAHAAHVQAHKHPVGGAGFTHRHMPEDHTIL